MLSTGLAPGAQAADRLATTVQPVQLGLATVTPFGSSILHGWITSASATTCLSLLAATAGCKVIERPEWAGGSPELLAKLDRWLADTPADLVVLHTATHDLDLPVEEAAANAATIIARTQATWGSRILLLGTWGTSAGHPLDRALSEVAERAGVDFLPLASVYAVVGLHTGGDGWHPNDQGHRRIADAMLATLLGTTPDA